MKSEGIVKGGWTYHIEFDDVPGELFTVESNGNVAVGPVFIKVFVGHVVELLLTRMVILKYLMWWISRSWFFFGWALQVRR